MSTAHPISAPLKNLLQGLAEQEPRPLLPALAVFAGSPVTGDDVVNFLEHADPNDPGMTQLRLAMAKWDASTHHQFTNEHGEATEPGTTHRRDAILRALDLGDDLAHALTTAIPVHNDRAVIISKTFQPWYSQARTQRSTRYWDDYEAYLTHHKHWPAAAIAGLDMSSDAVVERLSDPTRADIKQTRGLVVGYVQSGKTANFTGVIAKAIDAGYRLVIVMTGTIEILRAQTQRRLDMELMGVENVLAGQDPTDPEVNQGLDYQSDRDWMAGRFVQHTEQALDQPGTARIRRVTTHGSDYKSLPQGMSQLRYERRDKTKPLNAPENLFATDAYVVIVKKNAAPLRKLIQDLKPMRDMLNELPALIIDDESDLASVNTKNPKRSAERSIINGLITDIMNIAPRTQYVGYTATPFANVFIDPDDDSNIFPADFVLTLPRPTDYIGVQQFHDLDSDVPKKDRTPANSNEAAFVRTLQGDPEDHVIKWVGELRTAVDAWVLSGAIKKYREAHSPYRYRHHTMLIHEDVRSARHQDAAAMVRQLWQTGQFTSGTGLTRLRALYHDDFVPVMQARAGNLPVPHSFDDLAPFIAAAFEEMTSGGDDPVLVVNSDQSIQKQQESLDFDASQVWRILIGGAKLSRGFTVEGLTISYFRRKAGQADTLMQAGRWFGFRPGYHDLVRLYIRRDDKVDLYEAFEALLLDEEDFRDELQKYQGLDEDGMPLVEPRQIPPLVSQHLPWLKPTARNKMFNAVITSRGTQGHFHQMSSIPARSQRALHEANLRDTVFPLMQATTQEVKLPYTDSDGTIKSQPARVGLVCAEQFLEVFDKYRWHPDYRTVVDPIRTFIAEATQSGRIKDWAVVWPQQAAGGSSLTLAELPGVEAPIFLRSRRDHPRIDFTGENKRNILAASAVAEGRDVPGLGSSTTRGVVLVSLITDLNDPDSTPISTHNIVGLLSVRIPDHAVTKPRELLRWSVVSPDDEQAITVVAP